ncbi:ParB/RepB/Spo0J family partition protein [Pseudomonas sp. LPH60]|uniref:ParB/RepB/Spo0J family partition protein n=1 Tax=Pseudomonas sp. LPH60 TaxID=3065906 RepID=UPI00273AF991|nr:ParB/RepB/Spo0J family partition protein [Pseudomonas sp. LPH60]MDP4573463.1 ParB/RepB/Spo0J family partition protein [Pseudomonas sp. LPH60]
MLDLSALEDKKTPETTPVQAVPGKPDGRAMRAKLTDVMPDPNQPRKIFDPDEIADMGANIKSRGVKQAISVKPHPDQPGKWIINDGELRWRSSQWAEVEDIPITVDDDFDDFDQVNANEKRYNLRPIELTQFVQRKLNEGFKKGEIAKRLGKPANHITELLALIDPPECVADIYATGRCMSPKTIYELRALAEKFPEQVKAWCDAGHEVTRRTVADLGDVLKGKKKATQGTDPSEQGGAEGNENSNDGAEFRHDEKNNQSSGKSEGEGGQQFGEDSGSQGKGAKESKSLGRDDGDSENIDQGELTSWPRGKAISDPDSMKKPLLLVVHEGRAAAVLLNRRPSTAGLIRIRYEDGGGDAEVDAGSLTINLLTEAEK